MVTPTTSNGVCNEVNGSNAYVSVLFCGITPESEAGHVMKGGCLSMMVTIITQLALFLLRSYATHVIAV